VPRGGPDSCEHRAPRGEALTLVNIGGPRNHLTEMGGCRPPRREGPQNHPHRDRGCLYHTRGSLAGGHACRSMFTRVRASPRSITTASSHVVHVQRSLPSSARSTVTFPARAKAAPSPCRRVAPRRERMRSTSRSFDPLEVILPQVRGGRGSFYNRGRFCSQCVYLSLDVHESQGLAF
jgi:hypothetical protein